MQVIVATASLPLEDFGEEGWQVAAAFSPGTAEVHIMQRLRKRLNEFIADHNERLQEMTGDRDYVWVQPVTRHDFERTGSRVLWEYQRVELETNLGSI